MDILIPVLIAGFIAAVVGLIIFFVIMEKKRRQALQILAGQLGFNFSQKDDQDLIAQLSFFDLFSKGHSRRINNIMEGEIEDSYVIIFDYRYTTGGGKNSHTYNQSIILFLSDTLNLPKFALRPENVFHKIGKVFGYKDINFDHYPVFSKKYLLRAEAEQIVREMFNENVIRHFESTPNLCLEAGGNQLIFYRSSKRVKPEQIRTFLDEGFKAYQLFIQAD
ncbi:MAG: hypothetical protein ACYSR9_15380 [Planctomycetota bacterium]|jgi:hypothetical protein